MSALTDPQSEQDPRRASWWKPVRWWVSIAGSLFAVFFLGVLETSVLGVVVDFFDGSADERSAGEHRSARPEPPPPNPPVANPRPRIPVIQPRLTDDFDCSDLFADRAASEISTILGSKIKRFDVDPEGPICGIELGKKSSFWGADNGGMLSIFDGLRQSIYPPPGFDSVEGYPVDIRVDGNRGVGISESDGPKNRCQVHLYFTNSGNTYTLFMSFTLDDYKIDACKATRDVSKIWLKRIADS